MTLHDMIEKSVKHGILSELFTNLLIDQPQRAIRIADTSELQDLGHILMQLTPEELLITNSMYRIEQKDFSVINHDKELVLQVSKDGTLINNMLFDEPLTDGDYAYLERLLHKLSEYMGVVTLELA